MIARFRRLFFPEWFVMGMVATALVLLLLPAVTHGASDHRASAAVPSLGSWSCDPGPASVPIPPAHAWGVGMPALLHLHEFGRVVYQAFGHYPFLVGSALTTKFPRDIDVRLVLPMPEYQALVGPASECGQVGTRWAAFAVAFSALAAQMTGKSVDFQIQTSAHANVYMDEPRLPIGYAVGRFTLAVQPC